MNGPSVGRITWLGGARLDLTIGRASEAELLAAAEAATLAIANSGGGYTLTRARGGWHDGWRVAREYSAVVSMIADTPAELWPHAEAAAEAAWSCGCEAIQAELWHGIDYWAGEWRAS